MTPYFRTNGTPPVFVLDVSVAAVWLLTAQGGWYSTRVLSRMVNDVAVVPTGWPTDLADAVLEGERRGDKTAAEVAVFLSRLRNFLIEPDEPNPPHVWTTTVPLARRLGLPVGRAAYLELAARLALPLATTDPALVAAAPAAGVAVAP